MNRFNRTQGVHRVATYKRTIINPTGLESAETCYFSQAQADEIGAVLESDGISIKAAIRLCEMWTKRGNFGQIKYIYTIPFVKTKTEEKTK